MVPCETWLVCGFRSLDGHFPTVAIILAILIRPWAERQARPLECGVAAQISRKALHVSRDTSPR